MAQILTEGNPETALPSSVVEKTVVLIPVLNRPHRAAPVVESIRATSDADILFVLSPGDKAEAEAIDGLDSWSVPVPWEPGDGDYARKINFAFDITNHPLVFTGADDLEFEPGWLEAARKIRKGVVGTNDDANPLVKRGKHSTHSLVSRSYILEHGGTWHDGPGVVYHEGYKHQWVDSELVQAAMDRGEWAFARQSTVRHLHPMFHKATQMDDTYRKALGDAPHDKRLFTERQERARPRRR